MLFNSIEFAFFLPAVFVLYWGVFNRNLRLQNLFLVVASYFFYGWWDWRFLGLILFSTLVDYLVGRSLETARSKLHRKVLLWISIGVNIGFLGFFKYYNFFVESFIDAFSYFGKTFEASTLSIILPVGISFYTFQTLSYSIDVYRGKMQPTKDPVAFAAFVSFFPQLVAGPIERATNLLPQFYVRRSFEYNKAVDGLRQMLWGLFKKVVVADSCAVYANAIFADPGEYSGSALLVGAIYFGFQIYGDFSGYSDIAIGTSKLFGFDLNQNFSTPYFSRNIAEFWRRWHISLSTWFRDYLYIPLGGSRGGAWSTTRNIFIIFLVSGFWHGANWTFIVWGGLNALYILPSVWVKNNRKYLGNIAPDRRLPSWKEFGSILLTFFLTTVAWVFFRAESVSQAFSIIQEIFSISLFEGIAFPFEGPYLMLQIGLPLLVLIDWIGRDKPHALFDLKGRWHTILRYLFYYGIVVLILHAFWSNDAQQFIYFQF